MADKRLIDRATLDSFAKRGCKDCGHDHGIMYLRPRCHQNARTATYYDSTDGVLTVECGECRTVIVNVRIAEVTQ